MTSGRPSDPHGPMMRAWVVERPGPVVRGSVVAVRRIRPEPGPSEVLLEVTACGLCRTDLHLAEGDLPPRMPGTVDRKSVV